MDLPPILPVMTLRGVTLFPRAMVPLHVFELRYQTMLAEALQTHRMFIVAMRRPGSKRETPCAVAGAGLIRASIQNKNGTSNMVLQGIARVRLSRVAHYKPYRAYFIEPLHSTGRDRVAVDALTTRVLELVVERLHLGFQVPQALLDRLAKATGREDGELSQQDVVHHGLEFLAGLSDPEQVADLVACTLLPNPLERQLILETSDVEMRLRHLVHFLGAELDRLRAGSKP